MSTHTHPIDETPFVEARIAYKAYGDSVDWVNHIGNVMPQWHELPEATQLAWDAAANAVLCEECRS